MESTIFEYKGSKITFQLGNGDVMVNASEMAKPFVGKRTTDFLKTQQTQEFIAEYTTTRKIVLTDLVRVINGGTAPGTWMHEDIALEFARWLSPAFSIWCNDRIKELLKHGVTTVNTQVAEQIINNPDFLIKTLQTLKEERAEKERLQFQTQKQAETIQLSAPKVEYYDKVMTSVSTYTTTLIAKELGMSAITLNQKLHDWKIQFKQNDTWVLYHPYQDLGYTKTTTMNYTDSLGVCRTSMNTVWTEKGRKFIHDLIEKKQGNKDNNQSAGKKPCPT